MPAKHVTCDTGGVGIWCHALKDYRHFDHKDFKILAGICSGGFASVYAANWKNTTSKFAIKKITKFSTEKEIINEVCFNNL
jgi:hypothetical protein